MKIGFDARLYGLKHAGIGRYVMNLLSELSKIDTKNHYVIVTSADTELKKIPQNSKVIRTDVRHYSLAEQTVFLRLINQLETDFFHFPHFNVPYFYRKPFVVTIHDLLWHQKKGLNVTTLPAPLYALKYLGYRAVISNAIKSSEHIITPAQEVKHAINTHFDKPLNQISVTYEAADESYFEKVPQKTIKKALKKYKLTKPFIIYTGSLYPHKNVTIVLDALKEIEGVSFGVASSRNIFTQRFEAEVEKRGLEQRVQLLGFVPDDLLKGLYLEAEALIQPSESEGFGLTGLEAMATGVPVIAAQQPVLHEIYGQAATFFNQTDASALAKKIKALIDNPKNREISIKKGKKQAKKYSWGKMAQETLEVYSSLELRA